MHLLQIDLRKDFVRYKGPLSYTPSTQSKTSLLSTESPVQNYRGLLNIMILMLVSNQFKYLI